MSLAILLTVLVLSLPSIGAYAIFAIGIVLIYRASKVLNLAHGVMATFPAYVLYELNGWGVPLIVGLPLAIVSGGALGWVVERTFVRPFRHAGATAQTVGTVVVLGLGIAVMAQIWGAVGREGVPVFPGSANRIAVGVSSIRYGQIGLFLTMLALFAALTALFKLTDLGLLMRGSAENPRAAALMGVNPQRMTALTWIMGGALAGIAGILLAANDSVHPYALPLAALPGFLAALIGGLESVTGALVGGTVVAVVLALVPFLPFMSGVQGAPQLLLALIGLVAMAARGQRLAPAGDMRTGLRM